MGLHLRPEVFYCLANGKVVLLDLAADRYLALPEAADHAFRALATGRPLDEADQQGLSSLLKSGLLVAGDEPLPPPPNLSCPTCSGLEVTAVKFNLIRLLDAWRRQRQATQELDRAGLRSVVSRLKALKTASLDAIPPARTDLPERPLAAFLQLRRHIHTRDQCLRRSLGLMNLMARYHFYPTLVIGVRMKPFEAHAWVQWHTMVLNDTVDQVSRYTPILTV